MKKNLILIVLAVLMVISITACSQNQSNKYVPDDKTNVEDENNTENLNGEEDNIKDNETEDHELTDEDIITPESARQIIQKTANTVIYAIENKDSERIAEHVHPEKGVTFTPYTTVSEEDVVFSKEEMEEFFKDETVYTWGRYDGKGDKISLTPNEYYEEFIYSEDFTDAEEVGYNEVLSSGNMVENQFEVYDNPIVAEYYFEGFKEEYEGMDWKSLRLVFEEYEGEWKLVGIIHNQWTI